MRIESGLFDGQVLQRDGRDGSDARIAGTGAEPGAVWARVTRAGRPLRGFGAQRVGVARRDGRFTARLRGIPVGGPYAVALSSGPKASATPALTVGGVWVGDVWLLGGQSNMQGSGQRMGCLAPVTEVRAFYMDDRWDVARDPLHNLWNAVDPVHGGRPDAVDSGGKGVGPGLSFGQAMYARTGMPQGLIACAHGGTSMPQWDPMHRDLGGHSLYGAMVRRIRKNGGRVAGMIWYQGESDSMVKAVDEYADRMEGLVKSLRHDCGDARLPIVMAQLGRYAGENQVSTNWNAVQEIQRRLPQRIRRLAVVPTIDLALDDLVHIAGLAHQTLGARMAEAMQALCDPGSKAVPPIELESVRPVIVKGENTATFEVKYRNVVGALQSPVRPMGFDIRENDEHVPALFDTRLRGDTVLLRTYRPILDFVGKGIHYGAGLDPACVITDGAGRPLPVMGPVPMTGSRLASRFAVSMRISRLLPGAGRLQGVEYPDDREGLALQTLKTEYHFLSVYPLFSQTQTDSLIYIVSRFHCPERMKLALLFGYDGPVKLWLDKRLRLHDPDGTNPAVPDGRAIPVTVSMGDHEIVVALGSNEAKAWGIYLRFERLGIAPRQLAAHPERYPVPEFLEG